jgi:hypothetical protein
MAAKKACVLHTPEKAADAEIVGQRLRASGYEVCITGVSSETAKTVKAGDKSSLPNAVAACLEGASVCVLLIDNEGTLGALGGIASDSGCRVVTVGGPPDALPTELDDIVNGHVPNPDTPQLVEIVDGEDIRIEPDGSQAPRRKSDRVTCQ